MNLSELLSERNLELKHVINQEVNNFLQTEIDLERFKTDVINYYTNYIQTLDYCVTHITGSFVLHLKAGKAATLFKDNRAFKKNTKKCLEEKLNMMGIGDFEVNKLKVKDYSSFYKFIEICVEIKLLRVKMVTK